MEDENNVKIRDWCAHCQHPMFFRSMQKPKFFSLPLYMIVTFKERPSNSYQVSKTLDITKHCFTGSKQRFELLALVAKKTGSSKYLVVTKRGGKYVNLLSADKSTFSFDDKNLVPEFCVYKQL